MASCKAPSLNSAQLNTFSDLNGGGYYPTIATMPSMQARPQTLFRPVVPHMQSVPVIGCNNSSNSW